MRSVARRRTVAVVVGIVLLVGALASAGGCSRGDEEATRPEEPQNQEVTMSEKALEGKSVLMIIARQKFRDEELAEPRAVLEGAGAKVTIASSAIEDSVGMLGEVRVRADVTIEQVNASDYDAVIFVGGTGASEYFDSPLAHRIATEADAAGKLVCAICIAPATLANAGVLRGKKATCYSSEKAALARGGADYTGEGVTRDGRVITADGPTSARKFGETVRDALAGN